MCLLYDWIQRVSSYLPLSIPFLSTLQEFLGSITNPYFHFTDFFKIKIRNLLLKNMATICHIHCGRCLGWLLNIFPDTVLSIFPWDFQRRIMTFNNCTIKSKNIQINKIICGSGPYDGIKMQTYLPVTTLFSKLPLLTPVGHSRKKVSIDSQIG